MKISVSEDLGLRCLARLARAGGKLTIAQIAREEGLTAENTARILAGLREAGLIRSFRGKDGGYVLARPPDQIAIAEVVETLGGPLFELERCHGDERTRGCVHDGDCGIRPLWTRLGDVVNDFLSRITLADLVQSERSVCRQLDRVGGRGESTDTSGALPSAAAPPQG